MLDPERARKLTGLVKTPVPPQETVAQDITPASPQAPAGKPLGDSPIIPGSDDKPREYGAEGGGGGPAGEEVEWDPTTRRLIEGFARAQCEGDAGLMEHYGVVLADLGIELTEEG